MPTLQVLDREDPGKNPINAFQEQLRQQQETAGSIMDKISQVNYRRDMAKLEVQKATSDEAKAKAEQDAKEWGQAAILINSAAKGAKNESGGGYDADKFQKLGMGWLLDMKDSGVGKKFAMLMKAGPAAGADPKEAYQQSSADALSGAMGQSRAGAVGGAQPTQSGSMVPKGVSFGPSGATIDMFNPEAVAQEASVKAQATGAADAKRIAGVALNLVDNLESSWKTAFSGNPKKGVNLFGATGAFLGGASQAKPDISTYIATRKSNLSMLVRALGEKGNLSDKDVARIDMAIPTLWDSKEVAGKKFGALRNIINGMLSKQGGTSGDNFSSMSDDELRKIAGGGR